MTEDFTHTAAPAPSAPKPVAEEIEERFLKAIADACVEYVYQHGLHHLPVFVLYRALAGAVQLIVKGVNDASQENSQLPPDAVPKQANGVRYFIRTVVDALNDNLRWTHMGGIRVAASLVPHRQEDNERVAQDRLVKAGAALAYHFRFAAEETKGDSDFRVNLSADRMTLYRSMNVAVLLALSCTNILLRTARNARKYTLKLERDSGYDSIPRSDTLYADRRSLEESIEMGLARFLGKLPEKLKMTKGLLESKDYNAQEAQLIMSFDRRAKPPCDCPDCRA